MSLGVHTGPGAPIQFSNVRVMLGVSVKYMTSYEMVEIHDVCSAYGEYVGGNYAISKNCFVKQNRKLKVLNLAVILGTTIAKNCY